MDKVVYPYLLWEYLSKKIESNNIHTFADIEVSLLSSSSELIVFVGLRGYYGPFCSEEDVDIFITLLLLGLVDEGPVLHATFYDTPAAKKRKRLSLRKHKENGYRNPFVYKSPRGP